WACFSIAVCTVVPLAAESLAKIRFVVYPPWLLPRGLTTGIGRIMLDIKWIRENQQALAEALEKRGQSADSARSIVADLIARDEARRTHLTKRQDAQARQNAASKEIGKAMGAK